MKKKQAVPTWFIFLGILFAFLCFYVFLSCKVIAIGYKMQEAKKRHENLNMLNKHYKAEILRLSSQSELLKRAESFNIALKIPNSWCYMDIEHEKPQGNRDGKAEAGTH